MTALALILEPAFASAHKSPTPLPPTVDFDIQWFQKVDAHDIQDWDIEITPVDPPDAPMIVQAIPFPYDGACWIASVPTNGPALVRVRAVQDGSASTWSAYTSVPEPALGLAVAVGSAFLSLLCGRKRTSRPRPLV